MTTYYQDIQIPTHERSYTRRSVMDIYENGELPAQNGWLSQKFSHHTMSQYRRLAVLVAIVNITILIYGIGARWFSVDGIALSTLANLVVGNIAIAILIRQQYVINFMFWVATSIPTSWPLSIRWTTGKVYHFGGIHSGCAGAATLWFAALVGGMTYQLANGLGGVSVATAVVTYILLALLIAIFIVALPGIRSKYHDSFELMHRFGGWSSLLLFYVQTVLFVNDQRGGASLGSALLGSFGFWMLIIVTVSIVLPWLRLKKVPVEITRPSNHVALVKFKHTTPFAGSSTTVSRSPLTEWHAFANVPSPNEEGFRLTISRAGDWTGQFIDDAPSHVWVKGIATAGVGNIDKLFKRVVWVATGSGIGPTLPHLLAQETPAHLIWSTRTPRKTYGDELVDEILSVQPNATIWDTTANGKPDMVKLAYAAYKAFDAEAVIVISNQKLTRQVVYGMESRGIPAYGAIWDS